VRQQYSAVQWVRLEPVTSRSQVWRNNHWTIQAHARADRLFTDFGHCVSSLCECLVPCWITGYFNWWQCVVGFYLFMAYVCSNCSQGLGDAEWGMGAADPPPKIWSCVQKLHMGLMSARCQKLWHWLPSLTICTISRGGWKSTYDKTWFLTLTHYPPPPI